MFYVYILKSQKNEKLYIGLTQDLKLRLKQHNEGQSYWSNRYKPYKLIYYEAYRSLEDAKVREMRLKQFKKGTFDLRKRIQHSLLGVGGG